MDIGYVLQLACFSGGQTKKGTKLETILHHSLTTVRCIWNEIMKIVPVQAIHGSSITIHQRVQYDHWLFHMTKSMENGLFFNCKRGKEGEDCCGARLGWVTDAQSLTISQVTTKVLVNLLLNFPTYNLSSQQRQTAKRT